jgi:hypothetical protein
MTQEIPLGNTIKDALVFLRSIFADTVHVMTIIEETMNSQKLIPLYGSSSVWDRSSAYYGGIGWLTHYLNRIFVGAPLNNEKISFKDKAGAFVNVYFSPETLSQPIVVYGAIQLETEDFWPIWHPLLAVIDGPQFVTNENIDEWTNYHDNGYPGLKNLIYKVCPLIVLNKKDAVKKICLESVEKFNQLRG